MLISLLLLAGGCAVAQTSLSSDFNQTVIVEDAPDIEVFAVGKDVVVRRGAKGVLAIGGDITVEGRISGDVAAIGGSVIQRDGAYIGGDVIILGGRYSPEAKNPLRADGKETVMYAGYEDELREMAKNPAGIFSPQLNARFVAQRLLSLVFWFVISFAVTTLAPGAVGRAVFRLRLATAKIVGIGLVALAGSTVAIIGSLSLMPNYIGAVVGLMTFALFALAYVFGRVALHVSVGQILQKRIFGGERRSEAIAVFLGTAAWTLLLSLPYLWPFLVAGLFSAGIGLVLNSRSVR